MNAVHTTERQNYAQIDTIVRKIIHIDMDCFFAAIEMRDDPSLKDKPLAIGGSSKRGVLCTANYVARKYGVRSAMPTMLAKKLCPELIIRPTNSAKIREATQITREIFADYTDLVEPMSCDEAYLDVTGSEFCFNSATWMAMEIRDRIKKETGLTASAGVSINKFLAKVSSDWNKPDGLFVVPPGDVEKFMPQLPVGKIPGVGKVSEKKLHARGLYTCEDIQKIDLRDLINHFGKFGGYLHRVSRGIDRRDVHIEHDRKSISHEETYMDDRQNLSECNECLHDLETELLRRIVRYQEKKGKDKTPQTLVLKMKFRDFQQVTVQQSRPEEFFHSLWQDNQMNIEVKQLLLDLMEEAWGRGRKPVRLLGLGIRFRDKSEDMCQLQLL